MIASCWCVELGSRVHTFKTMWSSAVSLSKTEYMYLLTVTLNHETNQQFDVGEHVRFLKVTIVTLKPLVDLKNWFEK